MMAPQTPPAAPGPRMVRWQFNSLTITAAYDMREHEARAALERKGTPVGDTIPGVKTVIHE